LQRKIIVSRALRVGIEYCREIIRVRTESVNKDRNRKEIVEMALTTVFDSKSNPSGISSIICG